MAPTLRYISKLSGHLVSKHLKLSQPKCFVHHYKQYSTSVQPQCRFPESYYPIKNSRENTLTGNREVCNDVILNKVSRLDLPSSNLFCASELPKENVLLSSKEASKDPTGRPPPDKLLHIYTVLGEQLPKLFIQTLDYNIYHENIVFEDHIRNVKTVGLMSYVKQVALLRTVGHIKFAFVKFEILKITQHPEDGTVRVRWSIRGIPTLRVMFQFWRYKLFQWEEMYEKSDHWYDGFSTFYVNAEGKVVRHVADKMMPDSDSVTAETPPGLNNAKLALMIGVIPRLSEVCLFM